MERYPGLASYARSRRNDLGLRQSDVAECMGEWLEWIFNLATDMTTGELVLAPPHGKVEVLSGGSDGLRSSMMNPLVPHFLPLHCSDQPRTQTNRRRYRGSPATIPDATRELIRVRFAAGASLRALASEYHVSHETIRTIVRAGSEGDG